MKKMLEAVLLGISVAVVAQTTVAQEPAVVGAAEQKVDIVGEWTYSKGSGAATVTEAEDSVTIVLVALRSRAKPPHYRFDLTREGRHLNGTWECVIEGAEGYGRENAVEVVMARSGKTMTIIDTEDPDGHGIEVGLTFHRRPPAE